MWARARIELLAVAIAAMGLGCAGDRPEGGPGPTEAGGGGGDATDGDGGGESDGAGGTGGDGLIGVEQCKRVDLLIAVDNSGSMSEEMKAMRDDVFPAFARALRAVGGGLEDYHVGVIDACPDPPDLHTRGKSGPCNYQSGKAWMHSDSTALEEEFRCVGDIDSSDANCSGSNDDEQPAMAAAAALEAAKAGQAPNAGFLRDDALLVVILITDEDEQPVPDATTDEIYDRLVAVKGDVRKMVLLGVGGSEKCSGVYGDADEAKVLGSLTDLFTAAGRGVFWDLCQGKLEDGLTAAMKVIEEACSDLPTID